MAEEIDLNFEKALHQLEQIVKELETGELSLDDTIGRFEEGVKMVRICHQKLSQAEKKIEVLVQDLDEAETE
ncbi:MAG: exodeoxyribonuclease VII small subunit [Desulfitobacteriaceae bacterium]|nr:exodeoxyribonuclease VII small subunit [Desulfitobacteriaceae bacterium]MDD4752265.1 exodeoxyribonuclease VII small subunit [Desulfitobacteriaceae bacterium]